MKKYDICVVGSGFMARKHCVALMNDPRASLKTLVVAEESEKNTAFGKEFGFYSVDTNLDDAIKNKEIDIVLIISPNHLHEEHVTKSLNNEKHVFCEKPLAYSESEYKNIKAAILKSGKILQVGMNCRYRQQFVNAKRMADSGELGAIKLVRGTYVFDLVSSIRLKEKKWWLNYPGDIYPFLHTGAIHALDLLRWIGGRILRVSAFGNAFELKKEWIKDTFAVIIEFESGAIGEFLCSASATVKSDFNLDIWGTQKSISGSDLFYKEKNVLESTTIDVQQPKIDLMLQFDELIFSIENNKVPLNSFDESYLNFSLIKAIETSVNTNKSVKL